MFPFIKKPADQQQPDGDDDFGAQTPGDDVSRARPSAGQSPDGAPPAADKRLVDILASAIAEHDREMVTHGEIERLQFFRRSLQRLAAILMPAADVSRRHPESRPHLTTIADAVSDLRAFLAERCQLPSTEIDGASSDPADAAYEATPSLTQRLGKDTEADRATLAMELEGALFEVAGMRDVLARDHALIALLQPSTGTMHDTVRQEMAGINRALFRMQRALHEALGRGALPATPPRPSVTAGAPSPVAPHSRQVPAPQAAPKPAPPVPARAAAAPPPTPATPAAMPWERATSQPTPAPLGVPSSFPVPPVTPVPSGSIPMASPIPAAQEAAGLTLFGAENGGPGASGGPDFAHRSEEEGVKALQTYFESHSPEGTLLKAHEEEFTELVGRLLRFICPDAVFSQTDLSIRLRQLKDTLALRKKLRNTMTLAEFKAYFRKSR